MRSVLSSRLILYNTSTDEDKIKLMSEKEILSKRVRMVTQLSLAEKIILQEDEEIAASLIEQSPGKPGKDDDE